MLGKPDPSCFFVPCRVVDILGIKDADELGKGWGAMVSSWWKGRQAKAVPQPAHVVLSVHTPSKHLLSKQDLLEQLCTGSP